jgi:hypothetical protein
MEKNEMNKLSADQKIELTDEAIDQVSGGYSQEHWEQMSTQERIDAYNDSKAKRRVDGNAYCAFYDPNA